MFCVFFRLVYTLDLTRSHKDMTQPYYTDSIYFTNITCNQHHMSFVEKKYLHLLAHIRDMLIFMSWFRLPWAEAGSEFHSYGYFYLGFLHVSFQIIVNPRNKMSIKTSQSKKSWCCSWSSKRINVPRKLRPDPKSFIQKPMAFCKAKFVYVRNTFTSSFYKFNRHR